MFFYFRLDFINYCHLDKWIDMKTYILILSMACMISCNSLKRLTEGRSYPPNTVVYGEYYQISGITVVDHQWIYGVPIEGREVKIQVKGPTAASFKYLNQYEFQLVTNAPEPAIFFGGEVIVVSERKLIITGNPAVPSGSTYIITSEVF